MSLKTAKITLVKNKKLDCIYHKDSMLVFKSANEKLVIGRIENDEIISLDEKALELCEVHGFKYDESLVETEDATSQGNTDSQEPENNSENSTEPSQTLVQPVAQQPVVQPSQPVVQPSQPVVQPVAQQPVVQPLQPVVQPSQPVVQPSQPVVQPSQPVVQPSQPVVQPSQPVVQPSQPVAQPSQPVVQNFRSDSVVKQFEDIVNADAVRLVDYFKSQISGNLVSCFKNQVETSSERVSELEGQVASLRKELDETKKKMRGILAAIQADL